MMAFKSLVVNRKMELSKLAQSSLTLTYASPTNAPGPVPAGTSLSSKSMRTPPELVVETPQPPLRHSEMGTTQYTYESNIGTPIPAQNETHQNSMKL